MSGTTSYPWTSNQTILKGAIQLSSNPYYLTVVNAGGVAAESGVAIGSNSTVIGANETFTMVPGTTAGTFTLQTTNGDYVSVTAGVGGSNDGSSPIHGDATGANAWEVLYFIPLSQANNLFAICTGNNYYLTAVNGGGIASSSSSPAGTNGTAATPQVFTFVALT